MSAFWNTTDRIEQLASVIGRKETSMSFLLEKAHEFWRAKLDRRIVAGNGSSENRVRAIAAKLLTGLIEDQSNEAQAVGRDWNPNSVLQKIDDLSSTTDYDGSRCVFIAFHGLIRAVRLLHLCGSQFFAHVLGEKAVGDWLPPELVEIVREGVYSDEVPKSMQKKE